MSTLTRTRRVPGRVPQSSGGTRPTLVDATRLFGFRVRDGLTELSFPTASNAGFGISLDAKALLNVILASGEQVQ